MPNTRLSKAWLIFGDQDRVVFEVWRLEVFEELLCSGEFLGSSVDYLIHLVVLVDSICYLQERLAFYAALIESSRFFVDTGSPDFFSERLADAHCLVFRVFRLLLVADQTGVDLEVLASVSGENPKQQKSSLQGSFACTSQ